MGSAEGAATNSAMIHNPSFIRKLGIELLLAGDIQLDARLEERVGISQPEMPMRHRRFQQGSWSSASQQRR
jgi:hypothetical protein